MSDFELDALRARWTTADRSLDDALSLDREALRVALAGRTRRAFRRHTWLLWPGIVLVAVVLAFLIWFTATHWQDPLYLAAGAALTLLAASEWLVDLRQWRVLSTLDFSRPALQVQSTLDALRQRRLRLTQWILLTSVLLWLPAIAVLLKGLIGVDLLRRLDPSVVLLNLLVGLLFIPLAWWVGRVALRRFVGETGRQRFLDESVGYSWTRATRQWQAQLDAQQALERGEPAWLDGPPLPAALRAPLRRLQWRLLVEILVCAAGILAIGAFNAAQGGQWPFIAAGVIVNLAVVAQMVVRILQRLQLRRLDGGMPAAVVLAHFDDVIALRERVARWTLICAPILLPALGQVLGGVIAGVDLIGRSGTLLATVLAMFAFGGSLALLLGSRSAHAVRLASAVASLAGRSSAETRALRSLAEHALSAPSPRTTDGGG